MAKKQTSFERVMGAVEAKFREEHGTVTGAKVWLSTGIGISKQALDGFRNRGRFPAGYLEKISKFTGIKIPELVGDPADLVVELSRRWRVSMREAELILIWLGLDHLDRK